jgi:hypothetical protein
MRQPVHGGRDHRHQLARLRQHVAFEQGSRVRRRFERPAVEERGGLVGDRLHCARGVLHRGNCLGIHVGTSSFGD